jgi:hypothetical protein
LLSPVSDQLNAPIEQQWFDKFHFSKRLDFDFVRVQRHFQQYFSYIFAVSL